MRARTWTVIEIVSCALALYLLLYAAGAFAAGDLPPELRGKTEEAEQVPPLPAGTPVPKEWEVYCYPESGVCVMPYRDWLRTNSFVAWSIRRVDRLGKQNEALRKECSTPGPRS